MSTWRQKLTVALEHRGETWDQIESITLNVEGYPFTVWTAKRVYFPWCYDGSEGVASVSRHPDGVATDHVGGG